MRFSSSKPASLLLVLVLFTSATARIIGLQAPSTIVVGKNFTISLLTENYIQAIYDVAVDFGSAAPLGYPDSFGFVMSSEYLGSGKSNAVERLHFIVMVADDTPLGSRILSASVVSLMGAVAGPVLKGWNVTVEVGTNFSNGVVSSA